jgi:Xaa-Pro aminopeptidase
MQNRTSTLALSLLAALAASHALRAQDGTPEQRYWDWAELDFAPAEYQARRARLVEELRVLDPDAVLLIPSAQGTSHGPSFRQLDDFHYWTGLELPSSLLVVDARSGTTVVYAPARDPRFENPGRKNDFPGRPLGDDPEIAARSGLEILDAAGLETRIGELAATRTLRVNLGGPTANAADLGLGLTPDLAPEELLVLALRERHPGVRIENAFPAVARVRAVKSPAEIAIIRRVARLTEDAIRRAAEQVGPGMDERTLAGWFELGCRLEGAQATPFHPIVKSGPNALWAWRILASHYDRRNRSMAEGDLVIFDVGCELDHYVSDVGRTFPVSGSFSPEQTRVLAMQRRVADAIIAAIRPGVTLAEATRAGVAAMPPEARPYMQTGSFYSHHLGLSTGDPVLTEEPLRPGMVFTVEPWYYNHDTGISVFVEDMILVTEDGAEVLTSSLPRSAEGLEGMVGGALASSRSGG